MIELDRIYNEDCLIGLQKMDAEETEKEIKIDYANTTFCT